MLLAPGGYAPLLHCPWAGSIAKLGRPTSLQRPASLPLQGTTCLICSPPPPPPKPNVGLQKLGLQKNPPRKLGLCSCYPLPAQALSEGLLGLEPCLATPEVAMAVAECEIKRRRRLTGPARAYLLGRGLGLASGSRGGLLWLRPTAKSRLGAAAQSLCATSYLLRALGNAGLGSLDRVWTWLGNASLRNATAWSA